MYVYMYMFPSLVLCLLIVLEGLDFGELCTILDEEKSYI